MLQNDYPQTHPEHLLQDRIAEVNQFSPMLRCKRALDFFGSFGKHILWIGLSFFGIAHVYEYNTETEELRELVDKRVDHHETTPWKLHRLDDQFYYTGSGGKLMGLSN